MKKNQNIPHDLPELSEIMKLITSGSYSVNQSKFIGDIFECGAITISNSVNLFEKKERGERYTQIMNSYPERDRSLMRMIFGKIFDLLSSVVEDNGRFHDYLGELYMRCNQGNDRTGQFFTPYDVSKLLAKVSIGNDIIEVAKQDKVISISDPCCGAGGMLLAAIDVIKNDYGINYTRSCFFEGCDIDIRCVHMCYLQLSLAGAAAIIKHQNTLTNEQWSIWRTPAYMLQYPHFK